MAVDIIKAKATIYRTSVALAVRDSYAEDHGHEAACDMLAEALSEAHMMLMRTLYALEEERAGLKI